MKYLSFAPNVIRTDITDPIIFALDPFFGKYNLKAIITSVFRTKESQLKIIENYAKKLKLIPDSKVLNFTDKFYFDGKEVPYWQYIWSTLLNKGIIINPPIAAEVLMDYFKNGINKKNTIINPSPHFTGRSFDISGNDINKIVNIVTEAKLNKVPIVNILLERNNNCVHVDV